MISAECLQFLTVLEGAAASGLEEDALLAYLEAADLALDAGREDVAWGLRNLHHWRRRPSPAGEGRYYWQSLQGAAEPPPHWVLRTDVYAALFPDPEAAEHYAVYPHFSHAVLAACLAVYKAATVTRPCS